MDAVTQAEAVDGGRPARWMLLLCTLLGPATMHTAGHAGMRIDAHPHAVVLRRGLLAGAAVTATLVLSACGGAGMGHGPMPGAISGADMRKLMDITGTEFDRQFLTMMIAHHQGAVTMAREEAAEGSNTDAKALAAKIVTDQQAEIATMQGILDRL